MSILIKGMKMPKACCECGFNHCSQSRDDDTCLLLDKGIPQLFVLVDRLPDCPLVEIPPHGRLIDADKLERDIEEYHLSNGKFQHWVQVQNSIIEAEEGEA